ncbi:hypothetical protein ACWDUH_00455 [Micromonospora wenchangensis]
MAEIVTPLGAMPRTSSYHVTDRARSLTGTPIWFILVTLLRASLASAATDSNPEPAVADHTLSNLSLIIKDQR